MYLKNQSKNSLLIYDQINSKYFVNLVPIRKRKGKKLTNPASVMTSLVIFIFLTQPLSNSSSVHGSFLRTGGGFFLSLDCEYKIGVVLLLLMFLDREGAAWLVSEANLLLLIFDDVDDENGEEVSDPKGLF